MEDFIFLLLLWLACGCLGGWIAGRRGRSAQTGFILGFLVGPFGVILEMLLSPAVVFDTLPSEQERRFEDITAWHRHRVRAKVESRRRAQQRYQRRSTIQDRRETLASVWDDD
jgi:hypothetical protein